MITEKNVREVATRFLGPDVDIRISRAYGGFSEPCGYQLMVFGEYGSNQTFFHDDNTVDSLVSKMIPFVELLEDTVLLGEMMKIMEGLSVSAITIGGREYQVSSERCREDGYVYFIKGKRGSKWFTMLNSLIRNCFFLCQKRA